QVPGSDGKCGVQHRDIKPSNLLLFGGRVRIADFGLAQPVSTRSTLVADHSKTLAYAAPELFDNRVGPRTDQYSLAATYYHLRTGEFLFPRDSEGAVMYAHMKEKPNFYKLGRSEADVLARALAKRPAGR